MMKTKRHLLVWCESRLSVPGIILGPFQRRACLLPVMFACLLACVSCTETTPPKASAQPSGQISESLGKTLSEFNRGAALLEQYKYAEAAEAFESVLEKMPDWTAARFNLALAYFNLQGQIGAQEYLSRAQQAFEAVLACDSNHLPARFCLGLYHQHLGDNEAAARCFQLVHEADPADPYVTYKYAEALNALDETERALPLFEKIIEHDPGFVSAVYRLATLYQRAGRRDKAKDLFMRFRDLKQAELTGGTFTVLNTYGTSGKYYLALGADSVPVTPPQPDAPRIVFSPELRKISARTQNWNAAGITVGIPGMAAADVDEDGDIDMCLAGLDADGTTSIWHNDGAGNFRQGQVLTTHGICPSFGDVDNDGHIDLWLGRAGADTYFARNGAGRWEPVELKGVTRENVATPGARLLDIDSDGDLDLLAFHREQGSVPAAGPSTSRATVIYNNNRDGSFVDIAPKLGLALPDRAVAAAVYDDFDNDRDLDLILFGASAAPVGWVNDRVWQYHYLDAETMGLALRGDILSATSGDPDGDGDRDLLVFGDKSIHMFRNKGNFRFEQDEDFYRRCGQAGASGGQFADMDNDGDLDIVVADALRPDGRRGPALLVNEWPRKRFSDVRELDPGNLLAAIAFEGYASCIAADFTGNGLCDLFLAPAGERPFLVENLTEGGHWIQINLQGTRGQDGKSRSNRSAVGARVDIKTGLISQQHVIGVPTGPVASGPLRIHAGLGPYAKVDWLRITWPDAVLQAELELVADQVLEIVEVQRKVSSCPHLFVWNGTHVEFVSDFGGMGGIGYLAAPGVYSQPDPTEYVPVPNLQPRNGEYILHVVEPIEEVVFLDEAKLIAVDHPAGTSVYPNEMMPINAPPPAFEIFCVKEPIEAVRAVDHRGEDVTEAIKEVDRTYAGPTRPDPRFVGYAEDHFIELDLGDRLASMRPDARLVLFANGWVHYSYSSTNFAADQAGLRLRAPSVHVQRGNDWIELFREVGYPAGIRHTMTLDLTGKLLPTDRRIRISTNMELYWDRMFLAKVSSETPLHVQEVAVASANLHFLGYPREYSPDGRRPNLYDYSKVGRTVPWKTMRGDYTRYGDVTELMHAADDCYAIMGPGDEVTLRFPADGLPPVPAGYRRSFLLKADSYCKDMDLYSAHPDTVEPLPFHAMTKYPYGTEEHYPADEAHQEYRKKHNIRRIE